MIELVTFRWLYNQVRELSLPDERYCRLEERVLEMTRAKAELESKSEASETLFAVGVVYVAVCVAVCVAVGAAGKTLLQSVLQMRPCCSGCCRCIRIHFQICGLIYYLCDCFWWTATGCNRLQQTATQCNAMQRNATHCSTLTHTCNTLQHNLYAIPDLRPNPLSMRLLLMHCNGLQRTATNCNAL